MHPKKFRRAKAKRRRSYESILQQKAKDAAVHALLAEQKMVEAFDKAWAVHQEKERAVSALDDILKDRLAVNIMEDPEKRAKSFLADYSHPRTYYSAPRRAFYDAAVAFRHEVTPLPEEPTRAEVDDFTVRVFRTLHESAFRGRNENDLEISSVIRTLADRLAHLIFLRITNNALVKVKEAK